MLQIRIPKSFENERRYIVDLFFHELLGLNYNLSVYEGRDYEIELKNNVKLVVKDQFFSDISDDTYLDLANFPDTPTFLTSDVFNLVNLPVLYGNPTLQLEVDLVICEADIFASAFFLLTRWEEYVNPVRDAYGRFPGSESYLQKHLLHYRAIVNEYEEFLWKMLIHLGISAPRKQRKFTIIPTHDVDNFARYDKLKKVIRALAGDLVKRKSPSQFINTIKHCIGVRQGKMKDPYDMFDELMDMSDKIGVKSEFYFIPGAIGETDVRYEFLSDSVRQTIKKIESRGHIVGYHAGMDAFDNAKQFKIEVNRLRSVVKHAVGGRQHYLRFAVPFTWRLWDANGFQYDASICYENDVGFRAGIACEYPVFDILEGRQLELIERPTILMERGLLQKFEKPKDFLGIALQLRYEVEKHHGQFVFLWHPDNFNVPEWTEYKTIYFKILSE